MIGDTETTVPQPRRPTRAQQRIATRTALLDATRDCLVEDGWGGLSTRNIAERAGVAQSTLMHHFETREALLIEAVTHLASRLADDALEQIDLAALRSPDQRAAGLDQAWRELSSPPALAAAQLWAAAWSEPELAATLRELEQRLSGIFVNTAVVLFPEFADDPRFLAFLDIAISLFRGLVMAIPVSGRDQVDARWRAMRPILLESAAQFLGEEPA
ncbi:TetR/AcrR family transcriptional regulator [Paraconexibacter antarcticus]|uniref:TetR/AcrR family transcriptional regulator n=1 Tax=Paraconexibacter antarcticus TaxID=2949664 RepID=A0ABY5DYY5_9ACTN|nr:TetR/AcrR family transcriptional regulator [Paraconexibacter antarcticus]UTI66769.1 TetR/AcrR family transcriptional regulator [Paraconexibacter antarcticus]